MPCVLRLTSTCSCCVKKFAYHQDRQMLNCSRELHLNLWGNDILCRLSLYSNDQRKSFNDLSENCFPNSWLTMLTMAYTRRNQEKCKYPLKFVTARILKTKTSKTVPFLIGWKRGIWFQSFRGKFFDLRHHFPKILEASPTGKKKATRANTSAFGYEVTRSGKKARVMVGCPLQTPVPGGELVLKP